MSMICPKCGATVEEGNLFCEECGERVQSDTKKRKKLNTVSGGEEDKASKMGIASFVLGIISLVSCGLIFIPDILGLVFGIIAINDKEHKNTLAIIGTVLSGISLIISVIAIVFA